MLIILLVCCAIILTVILLKKFVLKVDYSEYSKDSSRLQDMIRTEHLPEETEDEK